MFTFVSTRPPLASLPALPFNFPNVRTSLLPENEKASPSARRGPRAQALTDKSVETVVTATGELDATRYGGDPQAARRWSACAAPASATTASTTSRRSPTRSRRGQYKQKFTLTREGLGAIYTGGDAMTLYFGKYRGKVENNIDPLRSAASR